MGHVSGPSVVDIEPWLYGSTQNGRSLERSHGRNLSPLANCAEESKSLSRS